MNFSRINRPALPVPRPGRDREARRYEVIIYGLLVFQEFDIKHQIYNARSGPGIRGMSFALPSCPPPARNASQREAGGYEKRNANNPEP